MKRGFTLIELLVVIAIIAILASLLLPALNRSRASARRIVCISNLKQLSLGIISYTDDNHGYFPMMAEEINGNYPWEEAVFDYVQRSTQIFECPGQPFPDTQKGTMTLADGATYAGRLSYMLSGAGNQFWTVEYAGDPRASMPACTGWSQQISRMLPDTFLIMDHIRVISYRMFGRGNYHDIRNITLSNHDLQFCNMAAVDGSARSYNVDEMVGNPEFGNQTSAPTGTDTEWVIELNWHYPSGRFKGFGR